MNIEIIIAIFTGVGSLLAFFYKLKQDLVAKIERDAVQRSKMEERIIVLDARIKATEVHLTDKIDSLEDRFVEVHHCVQQLRCKQ